MEGTTSSGCYVASLPLLGLFSKVLKGIEVAKADAKSSVSEPEYEPVSAPTSSSTSILVGYAYVGSLSSWRCASPDRIAVMGRLR